MWTLGFDPPLAAITSTKRFLCCGSDLHNGQEEFWTIPLHKTVSVQQCSCDVWCELLSRGHTTASQSVWGEDSDWATPEGLFSSVEAILLLIYFCVLGRCPAASPNFCCASIGRRIALHSPAKCIDKLGNSFFPLMIASCPGPEAPFTILYSLDEGLMLVFWAFLSPHLVLSVPSKNSTLFTAVNRIFCQ